MRKIFSLFAALVFAFAANAAVINITNETPDALRLALNDANDGDEIVMAAGTYVESNGDYIAFAGKHVTVKAAEGAEVLIQPQVPVQVTEGGTAHFVNVKFDASRLQELATWYEHLMYPADAADNNIILDGCEFYGFNFNKSMLYCSSSNKLAAITINNCYFHDCMKSILFNENTEVAINAQVTNSTFANISTNTESYYAGIIDLRAAGANLLVDHCTFYNVIPMNTDYSCVSKITLVNGVTSNCIFMLPTAQDGIRAMRGVTANNCITFNYLKDSGTGIHSSVTQNNCVQVDPAFVDPDNGNFTLGEGSPALTMNDGEPIGDPRWVLAPAPVLENGFYLVGSFNSWTPAAEYHLVGNPDNNAEFMINVTLAENDELKVVNVLDGATTAWFPGGDNYVVDAAHAGEKTVYFRPDYQGGEDWFGACIYIAPNAEPQPVEMTAIYDWAGEIGTTIFGGNTNITTGTVKIHENTDDVSGIKFGSSYVYADGKYIAIKPAEGAFKAGDVLSVSVVFNNSDPSKYCMVDVYAADQTTRLFRSDSASTLNGRTSAADPIVQTYTLEADQDSLLLGRYGNTGMFITLLKVERAGSTPIEEPAKFYITGDAATVGESLAWNPAAIKVTEDSYTLALAAGDYKLKVTVDGTWETAKGYDALTTIADGLSADNDGNICFTLAEAGDVVVTYTAEAFTLAGNFYVEPQPQECDWDAIDFLGDGSLEQTHSNQFKVCKVGEQPNVVNIQTPGFAAETGIYVTFPSAVFGEISLAEGQYVIEGAGMVLYLSAFTQEYTEVTINWDGNDIVFTVYNAAAAPQPVEHTYTVAGGSAELFGTTWDPANTANDMVKQEDGTYKWEKTEVTLPAGNVEFKVVEDHAWTVCYPAENYQLVIPEAGVYTITITYNPEGNVVAGDAVKTGDAVVDPVVSIAGSMNSWNASADVMTIAEDKATASLTLNLEAQTYEFKVVINGGDWRSNAQEFTRENATAADMSGNLDNMHLVADVAGEYVFTWTFETNTLVITFPINEGIDNTAVDNKAIKRIVNGQLVIEMDGVIYNAQGTIVR